MLTAVWAGLRVESRRINLRALKDFGGLAEIVRHLREAKLPESRRNLTWILLQGCAARSIRVCFRPKQLYSTTPSPPSRECWLPSRNFSIDVLACFLTICCEVAFKSPCRHQLSCSDLYSCAAPTFQRVSICLLSSDMSLRP